LNIFYHCFEVIHNVDTCIYPCRLHKGLAFKGSGGAPSERGQVEMEFMLRCVYKYKIYLK